jgi:hypothetical protein
MQKQLLFVLISIVFISCPKKSPTQRGSSPGPLEETDDVLINPFRGLACWVGEQNPAFPTSLQYVNLTWRELESARGVIDFARMERGWGNVAATGRRVGFRVCAALPGDPGHIDIPQWLADEGIRMRAYEIDGAGGLAPDWDDPKFLAAHHDFIETLGARYDSDPRVAWIDIGSYGFWGEWHVWMNDSLAAKQSTKQSILEDYFGAFPTKMKVIAFDDPFATRFVTDRGGGIRNDCLGTSESNDWYLESLGRIDPGLNGRIWKTAMIGGEFCGGGSGAMEGTAARFDLNFNFILETHWSFIGPAGGMLTPQDETHRKNLNRLVNALGYRFALQKADFNPSVEPGQDLALSIQAANRGAAPFYYPWPLILDAVDQSGRTALRARLDVDIRKWLPGAVSESATVHIPGDLIPGTYDLRLAICDPMTGKPGVFFANRGMDDEGRYGIGRLEVTRRSPSQE